MTHIFCQIFVDYSANKNTLVLERPAKIKVKMAHVTVVLNKNVSILFELALPTIQ